MAGWHLEGWERITVTMSRAIGERHGTEDISTAVSTSEREVQRPHWLTCRDYLTSRCARTASTHRPHPFKQCISGHERVY